MARTFFHGQAGAPALVEERKAEEGAVAVCRRILFVQRREIVQEVQRCAGILIPSGDQHICLVSAS